ncbi:hypothetical protein [Paraburkholderia sp. BCC1885]|uniref:hypothetical protein n=1 Tax=Paraburkholderia sp. BCC1885 TaxID=2562669 RepID=UPI0021B26B6D|nr:hypothetical protein [Paraburkholderia sp. BCC1885]
MTTISSLNAGLLSALTPSASTANSLAASAATSADAVIGSTIVTIPSPLGEAPLVYTPEGTLAGAAPVISWAGSNTDAVSQVMAGDYMSGTMSGQFYGLGSALLDRFNTTGSNFSQSVSATTPGGMPANGLGAQGAQGEIKLTVQTASGKSVDIELDSEDGTLSVSVNSSGSLSGTERSALAKLATGFQQAIDGLSGTPPSLNLSGLMQYDPSVLSSVNLQVSVTGEGSNNISANVALNSKTKSVNLTDSAGTINLSLDTGSDSAILGSTAQQNQAVASYLKQFDSADAEGHGNTALMSLFKDAFTQLNSTDGASTQQLPGTAYAPWLAQADQSMLTGLPDFTASITDTTVSSNPLLPDQTDSFSYQVSQSTQLQGDAEAGSITQTQQSLLKASFHTSLSGGPVDLTPATSSQTYDYDQVDDAESSTVSLATEEGKLLSASLSQSSSKTTTVSEYVRGVLMSNTTTPDNTSSSQDLLSLLKPFLADDEAEQNSGGWQQALSRLHSMILLGSNSN